MNEVAKWAMAGVFLLLLHVDFMGIPMVPGIVDCLVFRSGFRVLEREGDGEGFEWNHEVEQIGRLWPGVIILDLILAVFIGQSTGISIRITAVPMLAGTACGCSTLNRYGELSR